MYKKNAFMNTFKINLHMKLYSQLAWMWCQTTRLVCSSRKVPTRSLVWSSPHRVREALTPKQSSPAMGLQPVLLSLSKTM